jgi:DNA primase
LCRASPPHDGGFGAAPELRFPEVRRFAKALAQEVERRIGDQNVATTTWKEAERRGVFVDFGQNARDRTIASA